MTLRGHLACCITWLLTAVVSQSAWSQDLSQPSAYLPRSTATEDRPGDFTSLPDAAAEVEPPTAPTGSGLKLAPRSERGDGELAAPRMPGNSSTITTVLGGLGVVLGLFFVTAWLLRKNLPKGMSLLPSEVLEPLGRAPLSGKQQFHLVRVGRKLVLMVVTPFGAEALTEITDPDEVARLCALCQANGAHGPSSEFRAALREFEREPADPGFLGDASRSDVELARGRGGERRRSLGGRA